MKINRKTRPVPVFTHEGAPASNTNAELKLRRAVLATMLWEDSFYEDGVSVADRIIQLVPQVSPEKVAQLAIETRTVGNLRHVPLLLARAMASLPLHKAYVANVLAAIIQRPDELTEFLAIYWKDGKQPLSAQVKKGLARAFTSFNEYQLAKYNRDSDIKLRDVLFLCHAKPEGKEQAQLWKKLINGELAVPDTWEVALSESKGENKKERWETLLREGKLGSLALIRNLRNLEEVGVEPELIRQGLASMSTGRVLPFRFVTAARYAPRFEPELEAAMLRAIEDRQREIGGRTVLLLDVSGSMNDKLSENSDTSRMDAATGLAILAREMFRDVEVYTFSNDLVYVPPRRGFALRDAIVRSQVHSGTYLGKAIEGIKKPYDRLIVFTDEQSHDRVTWPYGKNYLINVANYQHGVGYGKCVHIDGFSESVLDYIVAFEALKS